MALQKWKRRRTRYFGESWIPYAQIEVLDASKRRQALILQIDTGAVVSLLRKSMAGVLGLIPDAGRPVELGGVGGGGVKAYVHDVDVWFDEKLTMCVPFAIAETEDVPNLLGREGVLDRIQLDFDGTLQATWIRVPWLSPNQRRVWDLLMDTSNYVIRDRWRDAEIPPPGHEAAGLLTRRAEQVVAAGAALMRNHAGYETPLIVRSLFELALQLEYLMTDPSRLGKLYLDFAKVTRHRWAREVVKGTGPISSFLADSPLRAAGEARNESEYRAVSGQYSRGKGSDTWDSWYCMSLRDLAKKLGRDDEYVFWYKLGSGWIHGDPYLCQPATRFPGFENQVMLVMMCHFYCRMLRLVSSTMIRPNYIHEFLEDTQQNLS